MNSKNEEIKKILEGCYEHGTANYFTHFYGSADLSSLSARTRKVIASYQKAERRLHSEIEALKLKFWG
jgi:hypothetical protein